MMRLQCSVSVLCLLANLAFASAACDETGSCAAAGGDEASFLQGKFSVEEGAENAQQEEEEEEEIVSAEEEDRDFNGKACCYEKCSSSSDCGASLFCCPNHNLCMDRSTGSTQGPNCNTCKNGPSPPPPPVKPVNPKVLPAGATMCGFEKPEAKFGAGYCDGLWFNSGFTRKAGATPSRSTGPAKALEGSHYLYFETSGCKMRQGTKVNLASSPIAMKAGASLEFDYHMYGQWMGSLEVYANDDKVWSASGNKGNKWNAAFVDLGKYAGQKVVVKFVAIRGKSWSSDVAIDELILTPGTDNGAGPSPNPPAAVTPAPSPNNNNNNNNNNNDDLGKKLGALEKQMQEALNLLNKILGGGR